MRNFNEVLNGANCAMCGLPVLDSGFKFSAYYDLYSKYWHIYCHIHNSYKATGNPNAALHTTNEIIKLYL